MKQRDLIKKIEDKGFVFLRNGSNHDIYSDGNKKISILRYNKITAKIILMQEKGAL